MLWSYHRKLTWDRINWHWFEFRTVASSCGPQHAIFVLISMCAPLHVSSWAESVRSVPVLNLSALRVSILELCQGFQLLRTIWGLFLFTTSSTLPLLQSCLWGHDLTHSHVHHVLWKATQRISVYGPERERETSMDTPLVLQRKRSVLHRKGIL